MKKNEVFEIMDHFQKSNLTFFSWEQNEEKIVMERKQEVVSSIVPQTVIQEERQIQPIASQNEKIITAPLVGTFYTKPSPDAKPFVQVGQMVHKGDVVGIIEAMKLMNEIKAKEDGVVSHFLVEDGKLVEFQQGLIALEEKAHV